MLCRARYLRLHASDLIPVIYNLNLQAKILFYPEGSSETSVTTYKLIVYGVNYEVEVVT